MNLAINGFGRIGRLALRVTLLHHSEAFESIVVNTSGSMTVAGWAHLLKYDTTYRKFTKEVEFEELKNPKEATDKDPLIGYFFIEGTRIPVLAQRNPEKLPWEKYQIDVVIESTGIFRDAEGAGKHLKAGAKHVVISAPTKNNLVNTYVLGVNKEQDEPIISNASCTTNCIAPITKVIDDNFKVKKAFMTTIHGYTDDQRLQDNSHKDLRRARAAAVNIIPTTTGAATATTKTIPKLEGMFDGMAIRVPVITGSIVQMVFVTQKKVTVEQVNDVFKKASKHILFKKILAVTEEPLVSSDIIGNSHSAIVDLNFTRIIDGDLVSILAWYDNEMGYTHRLVEQAVSAGE